MFVLIVALFPMLTCFSAYASADVFVIPSAFETLGNVVLESLASGVPVVGCNAGGIPHLLENNTNGFLFEPNDAASLCDAVGKLINDPRLRQTLGDNGMHHVANLSWRASSEYVEDIYKRVITKHGRRVPVRTRESKFNLGICKLQTDFPARFRA